MFIPVIGLEVHAELLTDSKIFCGCSAEFGGDHNTRCCPGCAGFPGTLPMLNKRAVEYAIRAGFTMNCDINKLTYWDRKNYFYPDLPTAYQISQLYLPLCVNGEVEINVDGQNSKKIRIHQIHLEEDAGKLVHDDFNNVSLADYNRGGIPLIEIVTEPDFSNAEEVREFIEKISLLLQYAGVCECKMEQGQLRADVNISLMRESDTQLGTRAEIKNLNSIKSITRAIEYEIQRQTKILQSGEKVVQETRRFNENRGTTSSLRSKVDAHDYRYFPDPDIPAVTITQTELDGIKAQLPELPDARLERYIDEYKLTPINARILIADRAISDFFDEAVKSYNKPKSISDFIIVELLRRINLGELDANDIPFSAAEFARLVQAADEQKIAKNNAKTTLRYMIETGDSLDKVAEENGFWIKEDREKLISTIDKILAENENVVAEYLAGEVKVFGYLMGQCTKALRGVCTPQSIKKELEDKLEKLK